MTAKYIFRYESLVLSCLLIFGFMFYIVPAEAQSPTDWSPPRLISQPGLYIEYTELVSDRTGRLHAFWEGKPSDSKRLDFALYYTYMDSGQPWQKPIDILTSGRFPIVRVDSKGILHLFVSSPDLNCLAYASSPSEQAYSARNWIASQRCLAPLQISQFDVFLDSSDGLHLVFSQDNQTLVYQFSGNHGQKWTAPQAIATSPANEAITESAIAVDSKGRIHVMWTFYPLPEAFPPLGILYSYSDNGKDWAAPSRVADDYNLQPQLLPAQDKLHVIWNGAVKRSQRYHRLITSDGNAWTPTAVWVSITGGILGHPDGVIDGSGILHAVAGSDKGAWYAFFNGIAWSPQTQLYLASKQTGNPSVAIVLGNELHVIFRSEVDSIWYTWKTIAAPRLTAQAVLPTQQTPSALPTVTSAPLTRIPVSASPAPTTILDSPSNSVVIDTNGTVFLGVVPVIALIGVIVVSRLLRQRNR